MAKKSLKLAHRQTAPNWCQTINTHVSSLPTSREGCFRLAFSAEGDFLAAVIGDGKKFFVRIYAVKTIGMGALYSVHLLPLIELCEHLNIIHDLCWSPDDLFLATASADYTCKVFDCTEVVLFLYFIVLTFFFFFNT
jgi:WD40 repeat protein